MYAARSYDFVKFMHFPFPYNGKSVQKNFHYLQVKNK